MQFLLQESKWNYRVQPWEIVELYVVYTITSASNAISLLKLALWNTGTAENTNTITAGHLQIEGFWHAWVAAHSKCCLSNASNIFLDLYAGRVLNSNNKSTSSHLHSHSKWSDTLLYRCIISTLYMRVSDMKCDYMIKLSHLRTINSLIWFC